MINYEEIFENLKNKYPECALELKDINSKIKRETIVKGRCNIDNCCSKFEKTLRHLCNQDNIYCSKCIRIEKNPNKKDIKLVISNFNKKYPKITLKIKSINSVAKLSVVEGICNNDYCNNKFEIGLSALEKNNTIFCKECRYEIKNKKISNNYNNIDLIIRNLNNKYPNTNLEIKHSSTNLENIILVGKCNTLNCCNYFEKNLDILKRKETLYCNECLLNIRYKNMYDRLKEDFPDNISSFNNNIISGQCLKKDCKNEYKKHINWSNNEYYSLFCDKCIIHPMQNSVISEKNIMKCFKTKKYILPSGKELTTQGYENYAIDRLLNIEKIQEDDIVTSRSGVPECWYEDQTEKLRRYYTDIYIPSQNRCIEVKSKYTSLTCSIILETKINALKSLGFNVDIWIFNDKGELIQ